MSNVQQLLQTRKILTAALRQPGIRELSLVREQKGRDQEGWLADHLSVSNPKNSEVLRVAVTVSDPKEAALLANAVVDAYMREIDTEGVSAIAKEGGSAD